MSETFCGTGSGNFIKPGDPDLNNSALSAAAAFGGIDVSWAYPEHTPHAVAFTILYRSTSMDPATRTEYRRVQGDYFYDRTNTATLIEYFYWIELISVNGTIGDLIGPASAKARPRIDQTMELLTGKIDNGALAQALKTELGKINTNRLGIDQEIIDRAASDDGLAVSVSQLEAHSDETRALVYDESLARADADSAQVTSINGVQVQLDGDIATVEAEMAVQANTLGEISALYTVKVDVNGLVGGFGVHNDGSEVEAGFDVDRFWVGRSDKDIDGNPIAGSSKGVKPFIIENGETFIKEAVIQKLTFHKLRSDDGNVMFSPTTYDSNGYIVEHGKLQVEYLEVNNIDAKSVTTPKLTIDSAGNLDAEGTMRFGDVYKYIEFNGTSLLASELESIGDIYIGDPAAGSGGFLTIFNGYVGEAIQSLRSQVQLNTYNDLYTYAAVYTGETSWSTGERGAVPNMTGTWECMGATEVSDSTDSFGITTYFYRYLFKRIS